MTPERRYLSKTELLRLDRLPHDRCVEGSRREPTSRSAPEQQHYVQTAAHLNVIAFVAFHAGFDACPVASTEPGGCPEHCCDAHITRRTENQHKQNQLTEEATSFSL